MRKTAATFCLLAAGLLASSCDLHERRARGDEKTVTITRSWPAAGIANLKIAEVDGSIIVEAVPDTNEISLVAVAKGDLEVKADKENQGLFETSLEGDTLRIGRREWCLYQDAPTGRLMLARD